MMLIVALPHSASTSMAKGVSNVLGIAMVQNLGSGLRRFITAGHRKFKVTNQDWRIRISDAYNIPQDVLRSWATSRDTIYKQHLLPTDDHIQSLLSIDAPVVIHTRDPRSAVAARIRARGKMFGRGERAVNLAVNEFDRFCRTWKTLDGNLRFMFSTFENLVGNGDLGAASVVESIVRHLGFDESVPHDFRLPRLRYTGVGVEDVCRMSAHGERVGG